MSPASISTTGATPPDSHLPPNLRLLLPASAPLLPRPFAAGKDPQMLGKCWDVIFQLDLVRTFQDDFIRMISPYGLALLIRRIGILFSFFGSFRLSMFSKPLVDLWVKHPKSSHPNIQKTSFCDIKRQVQPWLLSQLPLPFFSCESAPVTLHGKMKMMT